MKEYKLVYLNKGLSMSRDKDIEKAESLVNQYIEQGWTLQQVATPADGMGAMIGIFYKDSKL